MRHWPLIVLALAAADQLTKALVRGVLPLCPGEGCTRVELLPVLAWTHVCNPGASFSLLADSGGWQRWLFVVVTLAVVPVLVLEIRRVLRDDAAVLPRLQVLGAAAIIAGALGNLVDRLVQGCVTDFVLVHHGEWAFPIFNVADACISVGVALWLLALLAGARRHAADEPPET